ncbi:energy-coupling factor transporter transmembrane component T family protein [Halobacillus massiliensis]|uniref:energy-coupling factor transporter transmembrane component T family protein n=1 Tax=Halobacillus massiliensis TaxID=1926286 RepID=UPI0009E2C8C8|nr:energy-coupling factor transporter transmembrane component T [Halobacillus massiliensis]
MYLHNMNPTVKALTIVGLVIFLALLFDPITPLLYLLWTLSITLLLGSFKKKYYFFYFIPFLIFALGTLWTTLIFADVPHPPNEQLTVFGFNFPKEDVTIALSLSLRILAFAALSLLFIFTTNMIDFILSLIQQLKLPPKLAYGILAGYRFLPMMKSEFQQIKTAHRIRGMNQASTFKEKLAQYKRFIIPLLAGAIRKAERTAVAMESKGFTGSRDRTYYREFKISKADWIFPIVMFSVLGFLVFIAAQFGYFSWYSGQL